MPMSSTGSLVNLVASRPVEGRPVARPDDRVAPAAKAAAEALAARQSRVQELAVPSMTAESHKAVADLPRGSFLNILV